MEKVMKFIDWCLETSTFFKLPAFKHLNNVFFALLNLTGNNKRPGRARRGSGVFRFSVSNFQRSRFRAYSTTARATNSASLTGTAFPIICSMSVLLPSHWKSSGKV